jgi:hypothetical protein
LACSTRGAGAFFNGLHGEPAATQRRLSGGRSIGVPPGQAHWHIASASTAPFLLSLGAGILE